MSSELADIYDDNEVSHYIDFSSKVQSRNSNDHWASLA